MNFDELLALVCSSNHSGIPHMVSYKPGLCLDSRLVKAGDIFIAIKGTVYDGHDFIDQAIANGAKFVVCREHRKYKNAETIVVDDSAEAAAILAQAVNDNPASKLTNLAVTGTNGKTTVAFLVRSVIKTASQSCGLISTVVYDTGTGTETATLTTPDCITIAEKQRQMVKADSKYMVIEASSHALSQNRLAAIDFKAAAFTNLTRDHLDYHKTELNYLAAKIRLFEHLSQDSTAVLNKQSPQSEAIAEKTKARILWYAVDEDADLVARIESMDMNGTIFTLEYAGKKQKLQSALFGRHNVSNHLTAAGLCLAAGFDLRTIAAGLAGLKAIPGRLEPLPYEGNFSVLIDYAHTDDALKNVLTTLRPLCKGKLTVVFGCGGDRDKTKRPKMAAVAEQLADFIIVTSDNPRTEEPMAIIEEIVAGFETRPLIKNAELRDTRDEIRDTKIIEPDREKAINIAIKNASKDDIILIAGKGHETYQVIGNEKIDFNDKEIAQECLTKRK